VSRKLTVSGAENTKDAEAGGPVSAPHNFITVS
jgi:hypothetical protein